MYRSILFFFLLVLTFFLSLPGQAQNESDERSLLQVQNGISFTKDSLFSMNLRFRMQNRVGFRTESGEDLDIEQTDFRVRRLRMRLDGFVLNPRFQYYIQLGFSKSDMDLDGGGSLLSLSEMLFFTITSNLIFILVWDRPSYRATEVEW